MLGEIVKLRVEKETYMPAIVIGEGAKKVFALQVFGPARYAGFRACVLQGKEISQFSKLDGDEKDLEHCGTQEPTDGKEEKAQEKDKPE